MCEIFTIIGASIATAVGSAGTAIAGASAAGSIMGGIGGGLMGIGTAMGAAAGVTGAAAAGLGALAVGGIGAAIANGTANARSSKGLDISALNSKASLSADGANKTATTLKDNSTANRTMSSLRIPLKQTTNSSSVGANTSGSAVGLNIPT